MRSILKALVAVELQLCSDSFFLLLHCESDRVQDKVDRLSGCCLICYNTVVIQIPDHGQIQYPFLGMDIGNIRDPLSVRLVRIELPGQKVLVLMYLLTKVDPLPAAANLG